MIPSGHTAALHSAEYDVTGKLILTNAGDSTVKLWDAQTGALLLDLKSEGLGYYLGVLSPDGNRIAAACRDGSLKQWDAISGKLLLDLPSPFGDVSALVFSPDGSRMASVDAGGNFRVWDAVTGKWAVRHGDNFAIRYVENERINDIRFSPDGKKLVTVSNNKTVKVWDAQTGRLLNDCIGHTDRVIFARFAPDGKTFFTTSWDYTLKIWDATTGRLLQDIKAFTSEIRSAEFSPNGKTIATGSYKGDLQLWEAATGRMLMTYTGHKNPVWMVRFSPDGKSLLSAGGWDKVANLWSVSTGGLLRSFKTEAFDLSTACFSPDGRKILATTDDKAAFVWEAATGSLLTTLKGYTSNVFFAVRSPDGRLLASAHDDRTVKLWNLAQGKLLYTLPNNAYVNALQFSPDGKLLAGAMGLNMARLWQVETGTLVHQLEGHADDVNLLSFSPDGKKLATGSYDKTVCIWDPFSGVKLTATPRQATYINSLTFSPDGRWLVTGAGNPSITNGGDTARIWDAVTGQLHLNLLGHQKAVFGLSFSPDGNRLLTVDREKATLWNIQEKKFIANLSANADPDYSALFSPDGRQVAATYHHRSAVVMTREEGRMELRLQKRGALPVAQFSPDGQTLATAAADGSVTVWDAGTGRGLYRLADGNGATGQATCIWDVSAQKLLYRIDPEPDSHFAFVQWENREILFTSHNKMSRYHFSGKKTNDIISIGSDDYIITTAAKNYLSTPGAARRLSYLTADRKVITFEQLDVKYNRPDQVLSSLGNQDTALLQSYRKAYQKRVRKLGIDTAAFSDGFGLPEADFANRAGIAYEQKGGTLKLHIRGTDKTQRLDRFNVWVNESPLFGSKGITVRKKGTRSVDTIITVALSPGKNILETSVTNTNGTESYRMPLTVMYTPDAAPKQKLYFIGIGIDKFRQKGHDLAYSVKDIRDLAGKLQEKYRDNLVVDTLFDTHVTKANVMALRRKLLSTTVNDKVIVAYSGHGLLSQSFDYYLSTYDLNFQKPEAEGLPYEALETLLDGIPARQKLMLIDACHSGEVDKEEVKQYRVVLAEKSNTGLKGAGVENVDTTAKTGLKNSFDLMQELFVNVGRSTGATVISAAGGMQLAQEGGGRENGVFTFSILEYLDQQPSATVNSLKRYVNKRVPELTNGLQQPTTRAETKQVDWPVW